MLSRTLFHTGPGMSFVLGAVLTAAMVIVARARGNRRRNKSRYDNWDDMLGI